MVCRSRVRPTSWQICTWPDQHIETIVLALTAPGIFEIQKTAPDAGLYTFHVRARGRTRRDIEFTREQIVTAGAWHGGDRPSPRDPTGSPDGKPDICEILECLFDRGFLSPELRKRLRRPGRSSISWKNACAGSARDMGRGFG